VCEGRHERLGLVKDDAQNRDKWRSLTTGNRPTLPQCGNEGVIFYGLHSRDVQRVMLNVSSVTLNVGSRWLIRKLFFYFERHAGHPPHFNLSHCHYI